MTPIITAADYKGLAAWRLASDTLDVTVVPKLGGKITSLRLLPEGTERLEQNASPTPQHCAVGDTFEDGECAGWDDMFPNISAGPYGAPPCADLHLPDHGEVWCRPWKASVTGEALSLRIEGNILPYTLTKRVRIDGPVLRMDYELHNHGKDAWEFIWAAHPLFTAAAGMTIRLPRAVQHIINSGAGPRLSETHARYGWPVAETMSGPFILNTIPARNGAGYQKYYVDGPMPEGWVEIHWPGDPRIVRLTFPVEQVPYLGIWVNEGGWRGQYCVAPEPATAAMDSIEAARQFGTNATIAPGETRRWWLECTHQRLPVTSNR